MTLVAEVPFRPYSNEWIDDCRGMVTEAVYEVLHRRAKRRRELMQLAVEEELRQLQSRHEG